MLTLVPWLLCVQTGDPGDQTERIKRLEEAVRRQQEEIDGFKERIGGGEFSITFTDGLRFWSRDPEVRLHLGGRFIEHYRAVWSRPEGPRTQPDTFYTRQALILLDGSLGTDFRFMVRGDLGAGAGDPASSLATAVLAWEPTPEFGLVAGQFRAPQSYESLTSSAFIPGVERSIVALFSPGLEIGIKAEGEIGHGVLGYHLALTNGAGHLSGDGRSRTDDNDEKEVTLRLSTAPWINDLESWLHGLALALYGSLADADEVDMAGNFDLATTELAVTFLDATGGFLDGRRSRIGAGISWTWGSAGLRADYLHRTDRIVNGPVEKELPIHAWGATAVILLTGEEKVFGDIVVPINSFDPAAGHWGAFEAVLRVDGARVGREIEAVGNSLVGQADGVRAYTAGINWYPASNLRISLHFVEEVYDDTIDFGTERRRDLRGVLARFQLVF